MGRDEKIINNNIENLPIIENYNQQILDLKDKINNKKLRDLIEIEQINNLKKFQKRIDNDKKNNRVLERKKEIDKKERKKKEMNLKKK